MLDVLRTENPIGYAKHWIDHAISKQQRLETVFKHKESPKHIHLMLGINAW